MGKSINIKLFDLDENCTIAVGIMFENESKFTPKLTGYWEGEKEISLINNELNREDAINIAYVTGEDYILHRQLGHSQFELINAKTGKIEKLFNRVEILSKNHKEKNYSIYNGQAFKLC